MLARLKRWLGWDNDSGPFDFEDLEDDIRLSSRAGSSPGPRHPQPSRPAQKPAQKPTGAPAQAADAQPKSRTRSAAEALDNPDLDLSSPPDPGFDPYNTGAFNRSASWDRISKNRGR